MVTWQKFVSLCFEVKRDRGKEVESLQESQDVIEVAADLWNPKRAELRNATVSEAKSYIERNA